MNCKKSELCGNLAHHLCRPSCCSHGSGISDWSKTVTVCMCRRARFWQMGAHHHIDAYTDINKKYFGYFLKQYYTSVIGGSRGCAGHTSPYRTQFFRFHIHFCQRVPASGVHAPHPLREILNPPLLVYILNFSRLWTRKISTQSTWQDSPCLELTSGYCLRWYKFQIGCQVD